MKKQEIINKIKNREYAILNNDSSSCIKVLDKIFNEPIKASGTFQYYLAMINQKEWYGDDTNPLPNEIKATELLKILEGNEVQHNLPTLTETQQFKAIGRLAGRYLNKPLKQLNDYTEVQFLQRSGDYYHFLCDKKYVVVCVIVSE